MDAFAAHVDLKLSDEAHINKLQEAFQNPSSNAELDPFDELKDLYIATRPS